MPVFFPAQGISSLHYNILTDRSLHLLGSKHADGWHAQLRIAVHVLMGYKRSMPAWRNAFCAKAS